MINKFMQAFKENKNLFFIFLVNSLAGYLSAYLHFTVSLAFILINDFILISLLGGLKEGIKDIKGPAIIEMAGYGKRFFPRALGAHFIILFLGLLFMFSLFMVAGSPEAFYKMAFLVFSLVGFFLIFIFSSLVYFDMGIFEAIVSGLKAFLLRKPSSLIFLALIFALSYASVLLPYKAWGLAMFILVSVCSWLVYLDTFLWFRRKEA